jgi:hypothetical protein
MYKHTINALSTKSIWQKHLLKYQFSSVLTLILFIYKNQMLICLPKLQQNTSSIVINNLGS